ncbi:MAG: HigA family addiction module antidote protein [Nitrospirae bacterium]|nr:HigA family addiction module antidote protein [Nitrospirota bacterium]
MNNLKRQPTHPGIILREEFIAPLGLTQVKVAECLKTAFRTVNEIINGKRNVSPDMALRLARFFGTSEEEKQTTKAVREASRPRVRKRVEPISGL